MKKQMLLKAFLILLPILAVGLATTSNSVTVFDPQTGVAEYYAYFTPLPAGDLQMITPLAAFLSLVSGILAAIYLATQKAWSLKGIIGTSFCSGTLAVLPILLQSDVLIIPNVLLPILMMTQCLVAYYMIKHPEKHSQNSHANRLGR